MRAVTSTYSRLAYRYRVLPERHGHAPRAYFYRGVLTSIIAKYLLGFYTKNSAKQPDQSGGSASMGAVVDIYIDRLLKLQIDEGLTVYVVPVFPIERVLAP